MMIFNFIHIEGVNIKFVISVSKQDSLEFIEKLLEEKVPK